MVPPTFDISLLIYLRQPDDKREKNVRRRGRRETTEFTKTSEKKVLDKLGRLPTFRLMSQSAHPDFSRF